MRKIETVLMNNPFGWMIDEPSLSGQTEVVERDGWIYVKFAKSVKVRIKQADGSFKNKRTFIAQTRFYSPEDIEWLKAGNIPQFNPQGYMMLPYGNKFSRMAKRKAGKVGGFAPIV